MGNIEFYLPVIIAFANFAIFLVYALASKMTASPTAFRDLIFSHIKFSLIYIFLALFFELNRKTEISPFDWATGYFIYFGLHHTIFLYLHAIPRRSVSMNLCVSIGNQNGAGKESLENTYGQGKGIQFVAEDRLKTIENIGFVTRHGELIKLTLFGFGVAKIHKLILQIWNLKANSGEQNV